MRGKAFLGAEICRSESGRRDLMGWWVAWLDHGEISLSWSLKFGQVDK